MAIVTGKDSKIYISTLSTGPYNLVASVTAVSFSPTAEINKVTGLGDSAQKVIPGTQSFSGSVTCKFDTADTNGQVNLINYFMNGTRVYFKIYTDATNYWRGYGYIKSLPQKIAGGRTTTEVEFQFESDDVWSYGA